jgi:hypothetical protein
MGAWLAAAGMLGMLTAAAPAQDASRFRSDGRIVAIGDVHGDYDRFVEVLRSAGLVDNKTNWAGGKTHLVQTGDVPDRGPHTRKILELLMKLEKQAAGAKGRVHALIGNHEAMNVYGDLRYVIPEEYQEFRDGRSEEVRRAFLDQTLEEWKTKAGNPGGAAEQSFRAQFEKEHPLGWFEHRLAWGPKGKYGKWVRSHNAVVIVDDTMFLHGGIGPKYADLALEAINERVREELDVFEKLKGGVAMDEEGPLWYRGLAQEAEEKLAAHVDQVLTKHGIKRIAIGHSPTGAAVLPRFGGKVVLIDVGLSKAYGGPPACLVIENGAAFALHRGKKLALPGEPGAPVVEYLRTAAALDPAPSPIDKLIQRLGTRQAVGVE